MQMRSVWSLATAAPLIATLSCVADGPELFIELDLHEAVSVELRRDLGEATLHHEGVFQETGKPGDCFAELFSAPGQIEFEEVPPAKMSWTPDGWVSIRGWAFPGGVQFSGEIEPNPNADGLTTFALSNQRPPRCGFEWRVFVEGATRDTSATLTRGF
jgi:hypothetical protein